VNKLEVVLSTFFSIWWLYERIHIRPYSMDLFIIPGDHFSRKCFSGVCPCTLSHLLPHSWEEGEEKWPAHESVGEVPFQANIPIEVRYRLSIKFHTVFSFLHYHHLYPWPQAGGFPGWGRHKKKVVRNSTMGFTTTPTVSDPMASTRGINKNPNTISHIYLPFPISKGDPSTTIENNRENIVIPSPIM